MWDMIIINSINDRSRNQSYYINRKALEESRQMQGGHRGHGLIYRIGKILRPGRGPGSSA